MVRPTSEIGSLTNILSLLYLYDFFQSSGYLLPAELSMDCIINILIISAAGSVSSKFYVFLSLVISTDCMGVLTVLQGKAVNELCKYFIDGCNQL